MIPKKIFQSYYSDELPIELMENVEKLKQLNPTWTHVLFNDVKQEEYIKEHYDAEMLNIYLSIDPLYGAARSDLFRYLLLYNEGGVWLDIKSSLTKPLDNVLLDTDEYILSHWDSRMAICGMHKEITEVSGIDATEYVQFFIISSPKHTYLKSVIRNVVKKIKEYNDTDVTLDRVGAKGVLSLTGPIIYTNVIYRKKDNVSHREVCHKKDLGIVYSIYKYMDHRKLFKNHYSLQTIPIIR